MNIKRKYERNKNEVCAQMKRGVAHSHCGTDESMVQLKWIKRCSEHGNIPVFAAGLSGEMGVQKLGIERGRVAARSRSAFFAAFLSVKRVFALPGMVIVQDVRQNLGGFHIRVMELFGIGNGQYFRRNAVFEEIQRILQCLERGTDAVEFVKVPVFVDFGADEAFIR